MLVASLGDPAFTSDQRFVVVRSPVHPFDPSRRRHAGQAEYAGRQVGLHTVRSGVFIYFHQRPNYGHEDWDSSSLALTIHDLC